MSTADNIVESSREDKPSFLMKSATFLANYGLAGAVGSFFGMVNRMSEPATNSLILLDNTLIKPISNLSPGTDYGVLDMHPLSSKIMEIGLEIDKIVPDSLKYMAGIGGAVAGGLVGMAAYSVSKIDYKSLAKTLNDQPIVQKLQSGYEKFQPAVTMAKLAKTLNDQPIVQKLQSKYEKIEPAVTMVKTVGTTFVQKLQTGYEKFQPAVTMAKTVGATFVQKLQSGYENIEPAVTTAKTVSTAFIQKLQTGYEKFQPIVTMAKIGGAVLLMNYAAEKTHFSEIKEAYVPAKQIVDAIAEATLKKDEAEAILNKSSIDSTIAKAEAELKKTQNQISSVKDSTDNGSDISNSLPNNNQYQHYIAANKTLGYKK